MAKFHSGFVYETTVSAPLTIEGRPVELIPPTMRRFAAKLPDSRTVEADTLDELVGMYVAESGALRKRTRTRTGQLERLARGKKEEWNAWRLKHPDLHPMLAGADVEGRIGKKELDGYDFSYTNFTQANLSGVFMRGANFHQAILAKANLSGAHVEEANFCRTDLYETDFRGAHLTGANLQGVQLARTDLRGADLRQCKVYGLSAWDLILDKDTQQDQLRVAYQSLCMGSDTDEVAIVDGVDLAGFIYMTLNNRNISRVIAATGRKWVLLLGRFGERMALLEKLRDELVKRQYVPIVFDFARPENTDLIETVVLLAGMSAFVIVDITDPRSTPMELQAIAPTFGVPIVPIIGPNDREFGSFPALRKLFWVLPTVRYQSLDHLVEGCLDQAIIQPALSLGRLLAGVKSGQLTVVEAGSQAPSGGSRTLGS